jgi:hypothetical protein
MKYVISLIVLSAMTTAAMAADPKPSAQCWSDGTCLGSDLTPAPLAKPGDDAAIHDGNGRFYRPPVYYIPQPLVLTPSVPTPAMCYILSFLSTTGIYTPIACPAPSAVPLAVPLPRARHR